jgi:hypothetical protein
MDTNTLYQCYICTKQYSNYQSLWSHNKKFHKQNNINQNNINQNIIKLNKINENNNKIYFCCKCNKNFNHFQNKWRHEKICKNNINELETEKIKLQTEKIKLEQLKEEKKKIKDEIKISKLKIQLEYQINKNKIQKIKEDSEKESHKLKNEISKLNLELTNKNNKIKNTNGYIYIIHEREFIESNTNIYKIGRTYNTEKRIKQYSKYSTFCYFRQTNNMFDDESTLIKMFKDKFIHQNNIGNEYFKGDIILMIKTIDIFLNDKFNVKNEI